MSPRTASILALSALAATALPARAQQPAPLTVPMDDTPPAAEAPAPVEPTPPAAPSTALARDGYPLAGYRGGHFYLRDATDNFRLYPTGMLLVDVNAWAGKGVADVPGSRLRPRLGARAARIGFAGQVLDGVDFALVYAADSKPSDAPAASPSAGVLDAWINYRAVPALNVMLGQYRTPFTMQNLTPLSALPFHERPLTSSFGMPGARDIGATAWGDVEGAGLGYAVGVFEGDGKGRPGVDARADLMARITWKPLAKLVESLRDVRIGVGVRGGSRDGTRVEYDYPSLVTQQGYAFWQPVYTDSLARHVHVLPADKQRALAFELWVPWKRFDLQSELVLLKNQTREAVDGFQATNTERIGQLEGAAAYVQLGYTIFGKPHLMGTPGGGIRPVAVDFTRSEPVIPPQALDVLVRVETLDAKYSGASRGGQADAGGGLDGKIKARSLGLGVNYWASRHARISADWVAYNFPSSGTASNRAVAPGQIAKPPRDGAHVLHEIGVRFGVMF